MIITNCGIIITNLFLDRFGLLFQEEIKQLIYLKFIVFMFNHCKNCPRKCVESTFFSKKLYSASYLLNTFHFQQNSNNLLFQISKSGKHGN